MQNNKRPEKWWDSTPKIVSGKFLCVAIDKNSEETINLFSLEELMAHLTPAAPDEGYCEHDWSYPPEFCPVCNKQIPLIRLRR